MKWQEGKARLSLKNIIKIRDKPIREITPAEAFPRTPLKRIEINIIKKDNYVNQHLPKKKFNWCMHFRYILPQHTQPEQRKGRRDNLFNSDLTIPKCARFLKYKTLVTCLGTVHDKVINNLYH